MDVTSCSCCAVQDTWALDVWKVKKIEVLFIFVDVQLLLKLLIQLKNAMKKAFMYEDLTKDETLVLRSTVTRLPLFVLLVIIYTHLLRPKFLPQNSTCRSSLVDPQPILKHKCQPATMDGRAPWLLVNSWCVCGWCCHQTWIQLILHHIFPSPCFGSMYYTFWMSPCPHTAKCPPTFFPRWPTTASITRIHNENPTPRQ